MLLAVLPATAPRKPRCRSMLLRWRTPRLRVIDQRHCRAQRSTANVICMQIAICARSPSGPEHQPPTRHWHYPHSARTLSSGFVQSGFYEVALIPALLPSPYHATSQNPQDSGNDLFHRSGRAPQRSGKRPLWLIRACKSLICFADLARSPFCQVFTLIFFNLEFVPTTALRGRPLSEVPPNDDSLRHSRRSSA